MLNYNSFSRSNDANKRHQINVKNKFQIDANKKPKYDDGDPELNPQQQQHQSPSPSPLSSISNIIGIDTFNLNNENLFSDLIDNDLLILKLNSNQNLCFKGKLALCLINGSIQINGYKLDATKRFKFYNLYSPESNSFQCIKNLAHTPSTSSSLEQIYTQLVNLIEINDSNVEEIKQNLKQFLTKHLKPNSHSTIILFKKLKSQLCNYLSYFDSYTQLYQNLNQKFTYSTEQFSFNHNDINFAHLDMFTVDSELFSLPLHLLLENEAEIAIAQEIETQLELFKRKTTSQDEMKVDGDDVDETNVQIPVVLICGGKDVGKSTYLRYLINYLLNSNEKIAYIDCDPGQCEFTLSSCLQLSLIKEPLLGPPHTHLKQTNNCYFLGHLSPNDIPEQYLYYLSICFNNYKQMNVNGDVIPLVINTMGWNQGLGLCLLKEQISLFKPNFIIQINSMDQKKNLPQIDCAWYESQCGWPARKELKCESLNFKLLTLTRTHQSTPAILNKQKNLRKKNYSSKDHRNLATIAYFSQLQDTQHYFKSIHHLKPYKIPWSRFALHVAHMNVPYEELFHVFNASLIALCNIDEKYVKKSFNSNENENLPKLLDLKTNDSGNSKLPVYECMGFGIIRGINMDTKEFYVLTPEPLEKLNKVNLLIKGMLNVPVEFFYEQDSESACPYVTFADNLNTNNNNVIAGEPMQRKYLVHQSKK